MTILTCRQALSSTHNSSSQLHSALSLVHYRAQVIDWADLDWIQQIIDFMDKFYRYK